MTFQITIIGLGQIGASVGLSLAGNKDILRVGHDLEPETSRKAQKMGALDRFHLNIPNAVREADLILLSLPADQIREMMEFIGPDLREGAVVMETGPIKELTAAWASQYIPVGRHYVGLTPALNPDYLHDHATGLEAAHADLFQHGLIAITAPLATSAEAVNLAADLTRLLGATPLFSEALELDGLVATTHILPQLLAIALVNATTGQPGWGDGRKFAGRTYTEATEMVTSLGNLKALNTSVMLNNDNVIRSIDNFITALLDLRHDISQGDEALLEKHTSIAQSNHQTWWEQRQADSWVGESMATPEIPSPAESIGRLFGLGRRPKDKIK